MNTPANVFSALLLFFVMMSKMAIAQEAANKGGHFLRYLEEESPEPEPFFGFMSMPNDEIAQGGGEPTPSTEMSGFLSKFKEEHVKLAEALSGKVDRDIVVSSAFAGKLSEGVSAQNNDPCDDIFECALFFFFLYDEVVDKICIYPTPKSGKSGKAGPSKSKIKRFQVEIALEVGVVAPATIHDGKLYSPGIRNALAQGFFDNIYVEEDVANIFEETLINLLILENYLTCAGTKIENLLTIKFYTALESESIDIVAVAFITWWFLCGFGDFPEEEEDLALLLPTVHFVAVPGVFPGFGFDGLPFDFAVMVEAVAAV